MDLVIRPIAPAETTAFHATLARGFGVDPDDWDADRFYAVLPLERTVAAFAGPSIVGTLGEFDFELTVPGGVSLEMAGTTVVSVLPTHRRRGVLRRMMRLHLDTVRERANPLAGLWASETGIYGRFGFGLAVDGCELSFDTRHVDVPSVPAAPTVDLLEADEAAKVIPGVYEQARLTRAGMLSRSEAWWEHRRFYDPQHIREGSSSRRYAVVSRRDAPCGYVVYRQKERWTEGVPESTVQVIEIVSVDDDARRTLWHFVGHVDLYPHVEWWNAPVDDPLVWEVANRRLLKRRVADSLWVRLVDVAAALEARHYETDGAVVLEVRDEWCPWNAGTYRLVAAEGRAAATRVSAAADVSLDVSELGTLFLGGRSAHELHRAGRIAGPLPAIFTLDRLFRTTIPPWCPEVF